MDLVKIKALLDSLNEQQRKVASIGPGAAAVAGSAGAGKTRVLIARLARLAMDGFNLQYCLATTFTRAAAATINRRLEELGLPAGRVGTLHSVAHEIVQQSGLASGLKLDESGWKQEMLLKRLLSGDRFRNTRYDLDEIIRFISVAKASGVCPVFGNPFGLNVEGEAHLVQLGTHWAQKTGLRGVTLAKLYIELEQLRAANNSYDFDDMQLFGWLLLATNAECRRQWHSRWALVTVDEAMDNSAVQWDMAFLLSGRASVLLDVPAEGHGNLIAYGSPEQAIYSWRGAAPEMFEAFATAPDVGFYTLPVNYRSTPEICALASETIAGESWNIGGRMIPATLGGSRGLDAQFRIRSFSNVGLEARWVLDDCCRKHEAGIPWKELGILARLSAFLNLVEIECIRRAIPYEKRASSGGLGDSREVAGLVGYLRVAGGWDADGSWEQKIVNIPFRFIGKDDLERARESQGPDQGFIDALLHSGLSLRKRQEVSSLASLISWLSKRIAAKAKPHELLESIIEKTDFREKLRRERGSMTADASKLAVIEQMVWLAGLFDDCSTFVTFMNGLGQGIKAARKRLQASEIETESLLLSTIHGVKGGERSHIYVCDVVQGRHPWSRAHSLDEELRLLYVALTRAKHDITVTHSGIIGGVESPMITRLSLISEKLTNAVSTASQSGIQPGKSKLEIAPDSPLG